MDANQYLLDNTKNGEWISPREKLEDLLDAINRHHPDILTAAQDGLADGGEVYSDDELLNIAMDDLNNICPPCAQTSNPPNLP
jgi:hypothetical protein